MTWDKIATTAENEQCRLPRKHRGDFSCGYIPDRFVQPPSASIWVSYRYPRYRQPTNEYDLKLQYSPVPQVRIFSLTEKAAPTTAACLWKILLKIPFYGIGG
jgi:hypothetical protein